MSSSSADFATEVNVEVRVSLEESDIRSLKFWSFLEHSPETKTLLEIWCFHETFFSLALPCEA
jgi:hypothetical protein